MSLLSDFAKKQRSTMVEYLYMKDGFDELIEFDEFAEPKLNTNEKGVTYCNFRVQIGAKEYSWGIRTEFGLYQKILRYLSAGVYRFRVTKAAGGIDVEPAPLMPGSPEIERGGRLPPD